VPSVFHRELEKNYGLVPQSPTAITDGNHWRNNAVGISQRVGKKLQACATITDGTYPRKSLTEWWQKSHVPKCTPVRGALLPTADNFVGNHRRNYRRIKTKGGSFKNFGALFKLFPVEITDGNKYHRQELIFRRKYWHIKPPLPLFGSFFLVALIFISSPLSF